MRLYKRKDSPYWQVAFKDRDGQRKQQSTYRTDKEAARLVGLQFERDALRDPADTAASEATLADALKLLAEHCQHQAQQTQETPDGPPRRALSSATVRYYEQKVGHFVRLWGTSAKLGALRTAMFRAYVRTRQNEGASGTTAAKEVDALLFALRLAQEHDLYRGNVRALKPAGVSSASTPRKAWRTLDEVRALRDAFTSPTRGAVVVFAVATGAEASAIRRAERADVVLYPRPRHGVFGHVRVQGSKNARRARTVPVVLPWAREFLRFVLKHADGADGRLFRRWRSINRDFDAASKRAKVPRTTPHDLRRTYAHLHYQAGVTLDVLAPAMGHKDTKMLSRIYADPSADELAAKMARQVTGRRRSV